FATIIPFDENSVKQLVMQLEQLKTNDEKVEFLTKLSEDLYENREKQLGKVLMMQIERFVALSVIDNLWMDHLDAMDNLRQGIGLRGYGQKDPLVEYKNEGFEMFDRLMASIDDEIVHRIYKIQIQQSPEAEQHQHIATPVAQSSTASVSTSSDSRDTRSATTIGSDKIKLGRNDPCWCGSGKKYKKCHLNRDSQEGNIS
ncbi:SEC-C metal-binding domain-containing protein, partial [Patescibacteria group bacterium]|nr:SEC-C metal-binding domain-containing protein [Patescibacteria group bacterium]